MRLPGLVLHDVDLLLRANEHASPLVGLAQAKLEHVHWLATWMLHAPGNQSRLQLP